MSEAKEKEEVLEEGQNSSEELLIEESQIEDTNESDENNNQDKNNQESNETINDFPDNLIGS